MQPPAQLRIVLDTNLILQDIWYSAGRDTKKTALQDALKKSEYWVYMAIPMFQEVERKLRELNRGNVDKQIALWRTAYAPNIWTVRLKENAYLGDLMNDNISSRYRQLELPMRKGNVVSIQPRKSEQLAPRQDIQATASP